MMKAILSNNVNLTNMDTATGAPPIVVSSIPVKSILTLVSVTTKHVEKDIPNSATFLEEDTANIKKNVDIFIKINLHKINVINVKGILSRITSVNFAQRITVNIVQSKKHMQKICTVMKMWAVRTFIFRQGPSFSGLRLHTG